jgi:hypothetical protein
MSQLVQSPASGVAPEEVLGLTVGEAGAPTHWVEVGGSRRPGRRGLQRRQKERPLLAVTDQAGQQAGGAGGEVHPLGGPTLGHHPGPAVGQIDVVDVAG